MYKIAHFCSLQYNGVSPLRGFLSMNMQLITLKRRFFLIGACFVVAGGFFASHAEAATTDTAQDGRLITVHDRGETRVILTHAQTVRDALTDAQIPVVSQDTVEPNLEERLVATDYTVNIYRARPVIVVDGAVRQKIMTAAQTPEGITRAAGISLNDEDRTELASSSNIISDGAGDVLTIDRATPFILELYGSDISTYSHEATVGSMLKVKGIKLSSNDSLSVPPDTSLTAGMTVAVWRDGVRTTTTKEKITFPVRKVQDFDHPLGYHQVQKQGEDGLKSVTYEITTKNSKEVARKVIQSVVLRAAKEQVEIIGAAPPPGSHQDWMAQAGISPSDYGFVTYIVEREGGWVPCKVQGGAIDCSYSGGAGYGMVQSTPGDKMASAGSDWRTNPITQLKWASSYAVGRYGSWKAAYLFWLDNYHW